MKLGMQVGLGPGHIVLDGDPSPPPQRRAEPPNLRPIFDAAKWLHGEEGLDPGGFVFDGDPAPPPQKGGGAPFPIFGPCPLWPNGWMDQDGT